MNPQVQIALIHSENTTAATRQAAAVLTGFIAPKLVEGCRIKEYTVAQHDVAGLETLLVSLADEALCPLILCPGQTLAGSGNAVSAVIQNLCPKPMPGFGEQIRRTLLPLTPAATLLMPFAGIRRKTVMVHLPAESEWLAAILPALFPAIPNAVFLATGLRLTVRS
ncbi:hypothetical protein [Arsenicibacter rosenii]|uniref:MoaB/Mog domain-containing protein n=1 Tax=Arsenicibacter rosenii TaxID=1750698 RepID=A0A1S2VEM0_9BACT|nr:hypothetical protein [Arsenicibacter rosenii]OIN57201.1 hypothetical protein BLX24_20805 [Arsenicibacter rosenii]